MVAVRAVTPLTSVSEGSSPSLLTRADKIGEYRADSLISALPPKTSAPVAYRLEYEALNFEDVGSSPTGSTMEKGTPKTN